MRHIYEHILPAVTSPLPLPRPARLDYIASCVSMLVCEHFAHAHICLTKNTLSIGGRSSSERALWHRYTVVAHDHMLNGIYRVYSILPLYIVRDWILQACVRASRTPSSPSFLRQRSPITDRSCAPELVCFVLLALSQPFCVQFSRRTSVLP